MTGRGGLPPRRIDQQSREPTGIVIGPGARSVVRARTIIVTGSGPGSGIFVYSGTPARGTLVAAIVAPGTTADPFGNTVGAVANFGKWSAAGALLQHFGVDQNGDTFLANAAGLTVIHEHSATGGMWFYDSSGESFGHLATSISPAADTDLAGNPVKAGLASYDNVFGGSAQLNGAVLSLFTAAALVASASPSGFQTFGAANLVGQLIAGTLQFFNSASTQSVKPNVTGSGSATAGGQLTLDSGRGGGGATDAVIALESSDTAGVGGVATILVTGAGLLSLPPLTKIQADSWHTVGGIGQPAFGAGFAAGAPATRFQYEPVGGGRVRLDGSVNLTAAQVAGATIFTLPAGYVPANDHFFTVPNNLSGGFNNGFNLKVQGGTGAVQEVQSGSNGNTISLDGVVVPVD
jgi:hypothetical protein